MSKIIMACLIIVGLINILPVIGVLGAGQLQSAYGVTLASDELVLLMRHRALLFGIIGGFILFAAFAPAYQLVAMTMAAISMVGFVALVYAGAHYNTQINTVLMIDIIGIVFLVIALLLKTYTKVV